ncbi:MAG TPA: hypothetical protein VF884_08240 [Nitrososphaeraceae archaeon]
MGKGQIDKTQFLAVLVIFSVICKSSVVNYHIWMSTGLFLEKNDKNMLILIAMVIFVTVSDTMINQVADYLASQLVSEFGISLFIFFAIVFGFSQYILLRYIKRKIAYMYSSSTSMTAEDVKNVKVSRL